MPHQCVKCGSFFDDGASEILKGCSSCGAKLFFFVRKDKLQAAKEKIEELSEKEKNQIEKDVYEIIGVERNRDEPVVLDFESISILKPGKYELDLVNLFKKKQPLVYRLDDGKYVIDLPETFKKFGEPKE